MRKAIVFLAVAIFLFGAQSLSAQDRLAFELRGGASFATQDLGDASLNTGFGFEGLISYRFMPYVSAYAGWGWNRFNADESFAGKEVDFEETGYLFGLQFKNTVGGSNLAYYLRAGGTYNHIETENEDGDITADSGHGFGWRAELGVDIPFGNNWSLTPGVKYQSLSTDLEIETVTTSVDLNYFSVGVGIAKKF